ncbi:MAG: hypothetical protein ACTS4Z_01120 [Candidatus Hodgkinia cicadicola]
MKLDLSSFMEDCTYVFYITLALQVTFIIYECHRTTLTSKLLTSRRLKTTFGVLLLRPSFN